MQLSWGQRTAAPAADDARKQKTHTPRPRVPARAAPAPDASSWERHRCYHAQHHLQRRYRERRGVKDLVYLQPEAQTGQGGSVREK